LEVDDEAHPRTQIHERNRRKTTPNLRVKNQVKMQNQQMAQKRQTKEKLKLKTLLETNSP
jgi:hypothetical protein